MLFKPTHHDTQSPMVSISSVDDVMPQLGSSSPLPISIQHQNSIPVTIGDVGEIMTCMFGATTSRFTFRLPSLGRPKNPLKQAVTVIQTGDIQNSAPVGPVTGDSTTHMSVVTTEGVQRPSVSAVPSNASTMKTDLLS